jgi:hypothetical protein
MLGEHTAEILASVGVTNASLDELKALGVVHGRDRYPVDAGQADSDPRVLLGNESADGVDDDLPGRALHPFVP